MCEFKETKIILA